MRTFTVIDMTNKISTGGYADGDIALLANFIMMDDCGQDVIFIDDETEDQIEVTNESDPEEVWGWIDEHMGDE